MRTISPRSLKAAAFVALAALVLSLLAYVVLSAGPLAAVQVVLARVEAGTLRPSIFGVGTVEARRSWMVGPTTAGRVLRVQVEVGDQVKTGELLAEMDPVDLDQRLKALDASVARADSAGWVAQAQLDDAAARGELASINVQRNQELAAQNFISAVALESRLQEKRSADATHQAAMANLSAAAQELRRNRAEREALARQRANARLLAPAAAVVVSREAEAGSTVVAGQAVIRLIDPNSLRIRMRVDQGRSGGLAAGLPASIVLRSAPLTPLSGYVERVELISDSVTEERVAQVVFAAELGPAQKGSVGELAEVTLQLPPSPTTLLIPQASVQRLHGRIGVWRVLGNKQEFVAVRLGASGLDGQVQVLEGLNAGDSVVVYSQKALSETTRIKVVDSLTRASDRAGMP